MKRSILTRTMFSLMCTAGVIPSALAANCEYSLIDEWPTGFTAAVRITNDESTAIDGWEVGWEYPSGSRVINSWNVQLSGDNPYTATPLGWNSSIAPGQFVEFGVQGDKGQSGTAAPLPDLVGDVCNDGSSSSASSATSSSSVSSSLSSSSEGGGLPSVALERIFPNLELTDPVSMVQSPDGSRWYILEKRGVVSWVNVNDVSATTAETYIDLSDTVNDNVEGGMLGMAFHPDYSSNRQVLLSYTANPPADSDASQLSVIARYTESSDGATLDGNSRDDILTLEQPFNNHNGGQIKFGPEGYLYIAFGDGGAANDPFNNAQNPNNLFGTLVRVDIDGGSPYSIPVDNPFAQGGGAPEVYAYGLRNPWRFSFDPETDDLWVGDVGQASFEEIDIVENGGNYGWRCREGFEETDNECSSSGPFIDPVVAYSRDEGQSVTGGYVYRGSELSGLYGTYVFGDYAFGTVWGLVQPSPGVYEREVLAESELLITSFAQDINGELYAVDISGDALYQLVMDGNNSSQSSAAVSSAGVSSESTSSESGASSSASASSEAPATSVVCSVDAANVWDNGYQLDVTVTNDGGTMVNGWLVELAFTQPPQLTNSWNAQLSTEGNIVSASDMGWNANLDPGESTSFGLQGQHSGNFEEPGCTGL